jgi:hypothetical protein
LIIYLTKKIKKKLFERWDRGNEERGLLINKKPNQGVQERKKVGNRWSRQRGILNISHPYWPP